MAIYFTGGSGSRLVGVNGFGGLGAKPKKHKNKNKEQAAPPPVETTPDGGTTSSGPTRAEQKAEKRAQNKADQAAAQAAKAASKSENQAAKAAQQADKAAWGAYIKSLKNFARSLRSGLIDPNSPISFSAPGETGPKALVKEAARLINTEIPAARRIGVYNRTANVSAAGGPRLEQDSGTPAVQYVSTGFSPTYDDGTPPTQYADDGGTLPALSPSAGAAVLDDAGAAGDGSPIDKLKSWWTDLPTPAKVGIGVALAGAAFLAYKQFKKKRR